jgi:MoaA/NifB/PqqE/SkfB family radical SAM enzyme
MNKIEYLIGGKKKLYNYFIQVYVFFYFLIKLVKREIPSKHFSSFLRRLLFFLSKMKGNKYVKTGKYIKINLYVPVFPSPAFFKACKKVLVRGEKMPCISVLLSVTSACRYDCEHCYQKFDKGKDVDIYLLCEITKKLDQLGVSFFNIEGGEPFLVFDRLKKVCESISVGEIWINSTGDGMTPEKLDELKNLGVRGIMFSLHSPYPEKINGFMKNDKAWENLKNGIALCHQAGLEVAANTCISRDDYYNGNFEKILDLAKELDISIIQLIKPKPSGGWLGSELISFSEKDLINIEEKVHLYNNQKQYQKYPFISAQIVDEKSDMFGCTAGGTDRFYINAKGDLQPCEFLNISYGNIKEENFELLYLKMRKDFEKAGDKWLCESCSKNIAEVVNNNKIKVLPLSKELSRLVIDNWNRGNEPEFYNNVVKL